MRKFYLAIGISIIAIIALLSIMSVDASANVPSVNVLADQITGCLREYYFMVYTANTCWVLTSTFDGQPFLPYIKVRDSGNHTITFDAHVWTDWALRIKQYIWLPNPVSHRSQIIGDPILPHTVTIQYTLQSICGSQGCGTSELKVKLLSDVYENGQLIFSNSASSGATKQGTVTVVFTNTQYSGVLITMYGDGGSSCDSRKRSSRFSLTIQSINNSPCSQPPEPELYYQPVREGVLQYDSSQYASWAISDTDNTLVYAPTDGVVDSIDVEAASVVISSYIPLGKYRVSPVRAPENLIGLPIKAGCALGFYDQPSTSTIPSVWVLSQWPVTPSVGTYLQNIPDGGPCTEAWECFFEIVRERVSGILNEPEITLTLPVRLWPGFGYHIDFQSQVVTGAVLYQISSPRYPGDTYLSIEILEQPSNRTVFGPGILQIWYTDKADYIISPTSFVDGLNRLRWKVDPLGAANLHQVCVMSLSGGELVGVCPSPAEDGWQLGDHASWQGKRARLSDGGWIWKEATIFLPPSPSASGLPGAEGVASTEIDVAAISGKYEARVRMEPLSGSPTVFFEKELAPGVWKILEAISVTQRSYYNLVTQFDTGQQFLTIRLRASGGDVLVSEVCAEEEQRESELIEPCFGIQPYNPEPLTCDILECPAEQVKYHVRKFHDEAILPPLCKIAYWINYLYYYGLTTVGKPILMYLTTIIELIREFGLARGLVEAFRILLESIWISLIKPYGTQLVNWLWRTLQPVIDFLGISEYTLKLLQQFFSLLFTLFRKAFVILANGTVGLVRATWLGFKQGLSATPTSPPVPPESVQLGMELIGYSVGGVLILPLIVVFTGLIMWQFFFWSLKVLGIVR